MEIPTGGGERKRGNEEDKSIPRDSLYPDSRGSRKYLLLVFFSWPLFAQFFASFPATPFFSKRFIFYMSTIWGHSIDRYNSEFAKKGGRVYFAIFAQFILGYCICKQRIVATRDRDEHGSFRPTIHRASWPRFALRFLFPDSLFAAAVPVVVQGWKHWMPSRHPHLPYIPGHIRIKISLRVRMQKNLKTVLP